MKRLKPCLFSIFILFSLFVLASCNNNKKPTTNYEKVKVAFDGVEKSFKNVSKNNNKNSDIAELKINKKSNFNMYKVDDFTDALSILEHLYEASDSDGDIIDDLEYNQPPMIQFQCLKKVFEKIGTGFEFNTKYYDDIKGEVYFDIESGKKIDSTDSTKKFNYTFTLSISINIDSNDLIIADVSFDILLNKGNDNYNLIWYVNMKLDYDMDKNNPDYKLSMYTANNEKDLPFRDGYTYEYDYVSVSDNKINEWRKFDIETNQILVNDSTRNSFESYVSDPNFNFKIGANKWYRNNDLRKIKNMTENKKLKFGDALYSGLGLNSTDIDSTKFKSINGIKNSTISNVYTEFSNIFKMDIIYSLITSSDDNEKDKDDGHDEDNKGYRDIVVKNKKSNDNFDGMTIEKNPSLFDLLTYSSEYWSNDSYPVIYLIKEDNIEETLSVTELDKLDYYIHIDNLDPIKVNLSDLISDKLLEYGDSAKNKDDLYLTLSIPNTHVNKVIHCIIGDEIKSIINDAGAKEEILKLGFPEIKSNTATYSKSSDIYLIKNIYDIDEAMNYRNTLEGAGFCETNSGNVYSKITADNKILQATIYADKIDDNRKIELKVIDNLASEWDQNLVDSYLGNIIKLSGPNGNKILFDYITNGDYKRVIVYGLTETEKEEYFNSLGDDTKFIVTGLKSNKVLRIPDSKNNKFYEIDLIDNYNNLEISLTPNEYPIYDFKYNINGSDDYSFNIDFKYDANIHYYSDAFKVNEQDKIEITGSLQQAVCLYGDGFEYENGAFVVSPHVAGNYYIIDFYQDKYNGAFLEIQFLNTPDPNVIKSVSIVGDFNNWELNTGYIDFKAKSNKVYSVSFDVTENYKFKIVTNHSWYNGGYGYTDISNISDYPKLFTTDSDGNVITTTSFHLEINFEINDTKPVITITKIN